MRKVERDRDKENERERHHLRYLCKESPVFTNSYTDTGSVPVRQRAPAASQGLVISATGLVCIMDSAPLKNRVTLSCNSPGGRAREREGDKGREREKWRE